MIPLPPPTLSRVLRNLYPLVRDTNQVLGYQASSHLVLARAAADTSMHSPRHEPCATQMIIITSFII